MWTWLLPIGQWLLKLVGGFLPIGTKPVSEWLGKLLFYIGMFVLCMLAWKYVTRPTSNTTTHVDSGGQATVCTINVNKAPTLGCMRFNIPPEVRKNVVKDNTTTSNK
jgi:hypothetical protein